ncbi:MAG: hypothetical protein ABI603_08795 [Acidobacteriota bacterium]
MHQKRFVLSSAAAVIALAVACSKSAETPVAPGAVSEPSSAAAADGSTLKVPAPTAVSPVGGAQPNTLELVANTVTGKYDSTLRPSYEFRIKTSGGGLVGACNSAPIGASGATVTYVPTCSLDLDAPYSWSVRAVFNGAAGPWSSDTSFKTPLGGYITSNEIYDPLYSGKTVGTLNGPITFTSQGAKLESNQSYIRYQLPTPLTTGELSVMILGADEGSPGDKSKVFAMQQGDDIDITTNSYRMTAELRGNQYSKPGSVTCRLIPGDGDPRDCDRIQLNFQSSRWYFWKFSWTSGVNFTLEVRGDGPNGPLLYSNTRGISGRTYRPTPHNIYLGSPQGRGGPQDATLPGGIYKNLWVSSRPRPAFPGE